MWSHLEENVQRVFEWRHELAGRLRQVVGVYESAVHVLVMEKRVGGPVRDRLEMSLQKAAGSAVGGTCLSCRVLSMVLTV